VLDERIDGENAVVRVPTGSPRRTRSTTWRSSDEAGSGWSGVGTDDDGPSARLQPRLSEMSHYPLRAW